MHGLDEQFERALEARGRRDERRTMRTGTMVGAGRYSRDGRTLLDFSSNDYLGLARHPLLIERAREAMERDGAGAGGSRLVTGTSDHHLALEAKIAAFKHTEAALLFASGWQANAAVLPAVLAVASAPLVFADRAIHASMHAGIAAAGVRQIRFRHNDLDHLEDLLASRAGIAGTRVIVTESVFSMDGDRVDVARLARIARAHDAFVYLDEAHATGVLGPDGAGLSAAHPGAIDLVMGTFSKALGGFGAYVAGSRLLCDYLANACGGFVFTTAPPPAVIGAIDAALDLVPGMEAERTKLARFGDEVRARLRGRGFDTGASTTQIVPVIVGEAARAIAMSAALDGVGIMAAAIRPPTVPPGTSRLRLALRSGHDPDDIGRLLGEITRMVPA
jgi:8-amino-7-oxononanoate synthase